MIRFSKWLWHKSEQVTAQSIIDIAHAQFFNQYVPPTERRTEREAYMINHAIRLAAHDFITVVGDRYFPEVKKAPDHSEHDAMSKSVDKILREERNAKKTVKD